MYSLLNYHVKFYKLCALTQQIAEVTQCYLSGSIYISNQINQMYCEAMRPLAASVVNIKQEL